MTEQEHKDMNEFHEHHRGHSKWERCCHENGWWEERGIAQKILIGIGFGILGIAFISLIGWVTMTLWNALMPEIFGLKQIGYWQAWGLLILSCIFFKNFDHSNGGRRHEKKRKKALKRCIQEESRKEDEAVSNAPEHTPIEPIEGSE